MMLFKQIFKSAVAALFIVGAQSAMATTTDECYSDAGGTFATALTISPDVPATGSGVRVRGCLAEDTDLIDMFRFEALGYFQVHLEALTDLYGAGNVVFKLYGSDQSELASATPLSPLQNIFGNTFSAGDYYLGLTLNVFHQNFSSDCEASVSLLLVEDECLRPPVSSNYTFQLKNAPAPVPLPAALPMLLAGIGGLGFVARRRKNKVA